MSDIPLLEADSNSPGPVEMSDIPAPEAVSNRPEPEPVSNFPEPVAVSNFPESEAMSASLRSALVFISHVAAPWVERLRDEVLLLDDDFGLVM